MRTIEPSDAERSEWKPTTRDYVESLESALNAVDPLVDEFTEQAHYHYGMHAGFHDAVERLKRALQ